MLTEQIATDVGPAGLDIAYQLHGDRTIRRCC
jgi:hypothetical protein